MTTYKIAVIPGPGIGNEVVPEAVRLLESTDLTFDFSYMEIGYEEMCCKTQKCSIFLTQEQKNLVSSFVS